MLASLLHPDHPQICSSTEMVDVIDDVPGSPAEVVPSYADVPSVGISIETHQYRDSNRLGHVLYESN
jgi:hypothetical protein